MSRIGLGAAIGMLSDHTKSVEIFRSALGQTIAELSIMPGRDDKLRIKFTNGLVIFIADDGRLCCESRYITTDDDLNDFIGAVLTGGVVKNGPETENQYGEPHEIKFLELHTNRGVITFSTHNEHNGYYGGISIIVTQEQ